MGLKKLKQTLRNIIDKPKGKEKLAKHIWKTHREKEMATAITDEINSVKQRNE